ncbi:MAG: hypothetical protein FWF50_01520, partial [Defluviitaleaceae bacterium]|nr:hypothetical protein [Defluviitaleaceae bacterium]
MKKLALTAGVLFLVACGSGADESVPSINNGQTSDTNSDNNIAQTQTGVGGTIHLFNWGYFLYPPLVTEFEQEYGITVM